MVKRLRTTFIGEGRAFLDTIRLYSYLHLIVCERISGRRRAVFGSAFDYARKNNIPVIAPAAYFRDPEPTDVIMVSGYPRLLPERIINHPKVAIINVHQSYLPSYRGRHPLNWAMINGERHCGITLHHVDKNFDTGNIILQERVRILDRDGIMDVYRKTVDKGKRLIRQAFGMAGKKELAGHRQPSRDASYFPPRKPADGRIDWNLSARQIRDMVRALRYPYPGAYFYHGGRKIIVEDAAIGGMRSGDCTIGKPFLYDGKVMVRTGSGLLKLIKIRNSRAGIFSLVR